MVYSKHFVPLESDPEIFTDLVQDLGVSPSVSFTDVWSLEDEALAFVPRPVLALILVLPSCPAYEKEKKDDLYLGAPNSEGVIWLKQTIHNACGLYAILHAVCNNIEIIEADSALDKLAKTEPPHRVAYLESSTAIEDAHAKAAQKGQSEAPLADSEVEHHYICFVKSSDQLYQLDGDLDGPFRRGRLREDEDVLASKALDVIKQYINSEKDGTFSLMALAKS